MSLRLYIGEMVSLIIPAVPFESVLVSSTSKGWLQFYFALRMFFLHPGWISPFCSLSLHFLRMSGVPMCQRGLQLQSPMFCLQKGPLVGAWGKCPVCSALALLMQHLISWQMPAAELNRHLVSGTQCSHCWLWEQSMCWHFPCLWHLPALDFWPGLVLWLLLSVATDVFSINLSYPF